MYYKSYILLKCWHTSQDQCTLSPIFSKNINTLVKTSMPLKKKNFMALFMDGVQLPQG